MKIVRKNCHNKFRLLFRSVLFGPKTKKKKTVQTSCINKNLKSAQKQSDARVPRTHNSTLRIAITSNGDGWKKTEWENFRWSFYRSWSHWPGSSGGDPSARSWPTRTQTAAAHITVIYQHNRGPPGDPKNRRLLGCAIGLGEVRVCKQTPRKLSTVRGGVSVFGAKQWRGAGMVETESDPIEMKGKFVNC